MGDGFSRGIITEYTLTLESLDVSSHGVDVRPLFEDWIKIIKDNNSSERQLKDEIEILNFSGQQ